MFSIAYRKPVAALAAFLLIVGVTEARNPRGGATSPAALQITTTSPLTSATQSTAYTTGSPLQTMAASGGTSPYTWTLTSQSGGSNTWAVTSGGAITGTPTAAETDTLNIKVTDSASTVVGPSAFTLVVNASGGGPAAPTELNVSQGGGEPACSNNFGTGCATNKAILTWPASSGATYYTITRNGSALGSGGCSGTITGTTCTDATATNLNRVNTYGDETSYTYQVEACNGSGCSSGTYGTTWLFHGEAWNNCSNYSGGGFGGYGATTVKITANGTTTINVTSFTDPNAILPYYSISDNSGALSVGDNVLPSQSIDGALGLPGNAYILPYGTSGTTGTGGTGTYIISQSATGSATNDPVSTLPGGNSQQGIESCGVTQQIQSGHTYSMAMSWPASGAYVQQYVASPGSVVFDMNIGGSNYSIISVFTTSFSHGLTYTIHSRPGANISGSGDIYSSRYISLFNTSGTSSYGTPVTNAWFQLKVPNADLGLGTGQWTGYVQANWHGVLSVSGTTATIVSTTDGSPSNIAVGDYILVNPGTGWACNAATSTVSGSTFSVGACPSGGPYSGTNMPAYDAQVCASTYTTQPGPDNAGLIQGHSEPDGTYFGGGVIGYTGTPGGSGTNPTGTGSCTGTGNGHWGLFNGNGSTIVSAGSSGSPFTDWVSRRTSIYKPEFKQYGGSGYQTYFTDDIGWAH